MRTKRRALLTVCCLLAATLETQLARIPPAGRRFAPQRTDRRGGWGRAAGTAGAARGAAAGGD